MTIQNIFNDIPWPEWDKIDKARLKKEDVDSAEEFREKGAIPAAWLMAQMGLLGYKIGSASVSEDDGNSFIIGENTAKDHIFQLLSYIKQQIRDRISVQMNETAEFKAQYMP